MTDARRKVRTTIENTINALQGGDNKVNPLGNQILNKLADVTLTKCEQPPTGQLISECPFDISKEYLSKPSGNCIVLPNFCFFSRDIKFDVF